MAGKGNDTIKGKLGYLSGQMEGVAERLVRVEQVTEAARRDVADLRAELPNRYVGLGVCHDIHAALNVTLSKELERKAEKADIEGDRRALKAAVKVAAAISGGLGVLGGIAVSIWAKLAG